MNTLLLIEDEQSFADVLQRRLTRHGYECLHASDLTQGLNLAHQYHPSHLVLDMKVGIQNSLSILPSLRQSLPEARIILLTGYASIATAVEAIKIGADDYLAKPVDTQALIQALNGKAPAVETLPTMSTSRLEWEHIQQVMMQNQGNISATARQLGMHRRTLQRKLGKKPKGE
ncbi:response regulator transcription factor [Bowmanella yangjiangensis]|uniref:Response regulator n=1 Tax=Bowmanella yangjiangensis TaxID=2811230 RepID=A0ABS3D0W1_9ALTE|nr:response regulator [Bowmanella yangjiangensis]MBN7821529.1 response regulator [Bowmanella yangjiangensis]